MFVTLKNKMYDEKDFLALVTAIYQEHKERSIVIERYSAGWVCDIVHEGERWFCGHRTSAFGALCRVLKKLQLRGLTEAHVAGARN